MFFRVEVDQTFLKVHAKDLVKVSRNAKVMGRNRPPALRQLSFKFRFSNSFIEAHCLN